MKFKLACGFHNKYCLNSYYPRMTKKEVMFIFDSNKEVILLINDLSGTSVLELYDYTR